MRAPPAAPAPPMRPPAWATPIARGSDNKISLVDAAFTAGAGLALLDVAVRQNAPFSGAWRQRLALHAAAASLEGRAGDEAGLRDALALTRPGGDPGPAGRVYLAWRRLAADGVRKLPEIAGGLGAAPIDLAAVSTVYEAHARSAAAAPVAAAAAAAAVFAKLPRARPLAFAVADSVLASRLGWRTPLPLLAADALRARPGGNGGFRPGGNGGFRPSGNGGFRADDPTWPVACCAAYARAAANACDLHADLARAAARLEAVAPKLRAKGAAAALAALLDQDAISGAAKIPGLSDRGLRRLFDRLVALGAVRELTGRATFRLYGL